MRRDLALAAIGASFLTFSLFEVRDGSEQVGVSDLTRPPGGPDLDATGQLKVRIEIENDDDDDDDDEDDDDDGGGGDNDDDDFGSGAQAGSGGGDEIEQEFIVSVAHLDPGAVYGVFLENGTGPLFLIGAIRVNASGNGKLEFESEEEEDGGLPFGVPGVADLAGRDLEVRNAGGAVVLFGQVPALTPIASAAPLELKTMLTRPSIESEGVARGRLELDHIPATGRERIRVAALRLGGPSPYAVQVEVPGEGWTDCGPLVGSASSGRLEIDTGQGDALPGGAPDLEALADSRLRIRDGAGQTVLVGRLPDMSAGPAGPNASAKGLLEAGASAPGAKGKVAWSDRPRTGRSRLTVQVKKAGPTPHLDLWMQEPSTRSWELVASLDSPRGSAKFDCDTGKGVPLPFDATRASVLAGCALEVRAASGAVVASGVVPSP